MRLVLRREPIPDNLRLWAQRALLACAVALFGYCGFALVDAAIFQSRAGADLTRAQLSTKTPTTTPMAAGAVIGRIEVASVGLSAIVVEGLDATSLRRAVGHIPGTALPGEPGNVGLAGHRDTFFRPLKQLKLDDEIRLSTRNANFVYQVESLRIVAPTDTAVLASSRDNTLTLVTCYPFNYVGPAPMRWIVRARQVLR